MPDYSPIIEHLKEKYGLRVRKWRRSMSGCAWRVTFADGGTVNWIEAPLPRTPLSLSIFLHEVGHHAIGFNRYRLRCEEEYRAWCWAIEYMQQLGMPPDERVQRRFCRSMQYAVAKAVRRGLKRLPVVLLPFLPKAA